jgi:hypothetical protein
MKIAVLVVLSMVFCAVALTARWSGKSAYDHIKHPDKASAEVSSQTCNASRQQTSQPNVQADTEQIESDTELAVAWAEQSDQKERQDSPAQRPLNHLLEDPDDSGEPPDNRKDTYGDNDVE